MRRSSGPRHPGELMYANLKVTVSNLGEVFGSADAVDQAKGAGIHLEPNELLAWQIEITGPNCVRVFTDLQDGSGSYREGPVLVLDPDMVGGITIEASF
jgi:hypothetical protein